MIFFLKSCCSLNIYRSVGDGDNNNNQRKGVLAADVLLRLSESRDAERDAAPPASFQTPTDMGFQEEADGVQCATPPQPPQARALPQARQLHGRVPRALSVRVRACIHILKPSFASGCLAASSVPGPELAHREPCAG